MNFLPWPTIPKRVSSLLFQDSYLHGQTLLCPNQNNLPLVQTQLGHPFPGIHFKCSHFISILEGQGRWITFFFIKFQAQNPTWDHLFVLTVVSNTDWLESLWKSLSASIIFQAKNLLPAMWHWILYMQDREVRLDEFLPLSDICWVLTMCVKL